MFYKSTLTTLAAIAAFGSVFGGQSAAAREVTPAARVVSVAIAYGDLDLASQAGAKTMLHRIRFAAKDACGPQPEDVSAYSGQYNACVEAATDRAVASLNNPAVTAMNGGDGRIRGVALASARRR